MTPIPEDYLFLDSSLLNRQNRKLRQYNLKTRIRNILAWGIFLSVFVLGVSSCGKQKARIEPPRSPSSSPVKSVETPNANIPPDSEEISSEIPPAIITETLIIPSITEETSEEASLGPTIRIGLITDAEEIRISSTGDYYLLENVPETSKQLIRGDIRIRVERDGETGKNVVCFRIQVASLQSRESAEKLRNSLAETFKTKVVVRENAEETSNRVRVGEFQTRAEAGELWDRLKHSGYPDSFIVEDIRSTKTGKTTLALRGSDNLFVLNNCGISVPAGDGL